MSTSVREAAVDLVGKHVLQDVALMEKYNDLILERLLDKGVSVRKRVLRVVEGVCEIYTQKAKGENKVF